MKQFLIILLIGIIHSPLLSQNDKIINNIDFNAYTQLRGTSNFNDYTSFSVRRLKLWVKSKPGFSNHWSFKIQTLFSSFTQEKLMLQDVTIGYKTGLFSFNIGQFVPQFSLQWFQPDFLIPSIERARAVNILVPDGTLGVRDIGVQASFKTKNNLLETHLGVFNGYGIKEYRFKNSGYMISHKSQLNIPIAGNKLKIGYSLQYRLAEELQLKFIFPDSVYYSGNDFRYNLFAMFTSKYIEVQAEYLNADFDGEKAYGYYLLAALNLGKNQVVLSWENYIDIIDETIDKPYYRVGYNYLFNDHKLMLSLDNYFQIVNNQIEKYSMSIQLQIFLF